MKAIITHFDGDPFVINAWLTLYGKYWRGEVDTIFASVFYKPELIPAEVIEFNKSLFAQYPEIRVTWLDRWEIPELANQRLIEQLPPEYTEIGLIESDGFVYGSNVIATCFNLLKEGQDIVAPEWELINEPWIQGETGTKGYMRCFFFTKRSILNQIDIDFTPVELPKGHVIEELGYMLPKELRLDCFGWISLQLALKKLKWTRIPGNLVANKDNYNETFDNNYPWLHIRQMSSSALGLGGGEYGLWNKKDDKMIVKRVFELFNEDLPNGPAEFIYLKAVAFRLLFWDILKDKSALGDFAKEYKQVLEAVIGYYNLPIAKIYEFKGFFKGLMRI